MKPTATITLKRGDKVMHMSAGAINTLEDITNPGNPIAEDSLEWRKQVRIALEGLLETVQHQRLPKQRLEDFCVIITSMTGDLVAELPEA